MVHFFGSTGSVRPAPLPTRYLLMETYIVAGSGKSILWFVDHYLYQT
jgi:hypothetical protein